jgi:methyl-accepting chemotaxis protein
VIGIELSTTQQEKIMTRGNEPDSRERIFLGTEKGVPIMQGMGAFTGRLTDNALIQAKLSGRWSGRRLTAEGLEVFGYYVKQDRYPWVLGAEIETGEVLGDLHTLHLILLAGLVGVVVVLTAMSLIFARQMVKPIDAIVAEMERISRGDFDIEIPGAGRRDEFGKLSTTLQQLVFTLQRAAKKLRQYKTLKKAS